MKNFKKPQLLVLGLAVFLVVLLLLLPRNGGDSRSEDEESEVAATEVSDSPEAMDELLTQRYQGILASIEASTDPLEKINLYDTLSMFWEEQGNLVKSGDALYEAAGIIQDKPSYFIAGDKYFQAFQSEFTTNRKQAITKAIKSYNKVLELFPEDLEAQTSLAVCYVEGSAVTGEAPMKGIQMLRDVLEKDPRNINALINLGYFAVQSGQLDKAIERFKQVQEIDPRYADVYLYLSDIYLKLGEKNKAIGQLEKYRELVEDPAAIQQLDEYIEKLKNSNV